MMNGLNIETLKQIESQFGEFDIKQVMGGSNDIYLRFGYWRPVNIGKLQEIIGNGIRVVEDDDYDDDCGYQFMYRLK
jgi:hypothetical protein